MENIKLPRTKRTPEIDFDFADNKFAIRGECYSENVNDVFGEPIRRLGEHFSKQDGANIQFDFELIYFNSRASMILINFCDLLKDAANAGNNLTVNWHYAEDDENVEELGTEFAGYFEHGTFKMCPFAD